MKLNDRETPIDALSVCKSLISSTSFCALLLAFGAQSLSAQTLTTITGDLEVVAGGGSPGDLDIDDDLTVGDDLFVEGKIGHTGNNVVADDGVALGHGNHVHGGSSAAIGYQNYASGWTSFATGGNNDALGNVSSTLGGWGNISYVEGASTLGADNLAYGLYSFVWGDDNTAYGDFSTVWGANNLSEAFLSTVFGQYNVGGYTFYDDGDDTNDGDTQWIPEDPLLEVGIGDSVTSANALTILKNGKVGIGLWGDDLWDTSTVGKNTEDSLLRVNGKVESTSGGFVLPDGTVIDEASDLSVPMESLSASDGSAVVTVIDSQNAEVSGDLTVTGQILQTAAFGDISMGGFTAQ